MEKDLSTPILDAARICMATWEESLSAALPGFPPMEHFDFDAALERFTTAAWVDVTFLTHSERMIAADKAADEDFDEDLLDLAPEQMVAKLSDGRSKTRSTEESPQRP
jgi:hypothetical protein